MSNPFRKQTGAPPPQLQIPPIDSAHTNAITSSTSSSGSTSPRPTPPPPPATTFRTSSSSPPPPWEDDRLGDGGRGGRGYEDNIEEDGGGRERRRSKVIKKVRVLSPPPLSPDSPEWSYRDAGVHLPRSVFAASPSTSDSFGSTDALAHSTLRPDTHNDVNSSSTISSSSLGPPPANPFSKTLEDLENAKKHEDLVVERKGEGAALKAANVARGSLDVDAFKRLLMTGHAGHTGDGPPFPTSSAAAEKAALSISRDIEATRPAGASEATAVVDGNESDSSVTVQIGTRKKAPPPPPSSRHGKSIRSAADGKGSPEATAGVAAASETKTSHDERPPQQEKETTAEGHAKGERLNEADSVAATKKPVPAPPPRRGHARMESRVEQGLTIAKDDESSAPPRSSMEAAIPARSNSVRHSNVPAPPPPRRLQGAGQRPTSLLPSPNLQPTPVADDAVSITSPLHEHATPPLDRTSHSLPPDPSSHIKPSTPAPPPPPARNTSIRRPPSVHSTEPASRRTSTETKRRTSTETRGRVGDGTLSPSSLPPPPPPARKRGNSKSSVGEGGPLPPLPPMPRIGSKDGVAAGAGGAGAGARGPEVAAAVPGHGEEILADLDALKREVDALRGQFH